MRLLEDSRQRWLTAVYVIGMFAGHMHSARASNEEVTLEFSGQIRERFESISHPSFGLASEASDAYLLHRGTLAALVNAGKRFALTSEIVSAHVSGAVTTLSGAQDNPLDLLQFYAEGKFVDGSVRMRIGRQALALGTARLVSMRDNTNTRRSFDGLRASWTRERMHLDAFYLRPVLPQTEVFDDKASRVQTFWGLYLTRDAAQSESSGIDLYYLGLRNERAYFALESASELRHTVGARLFGASESNDWNFEAAWQWGSFGASRVRAWTLSSDVGYTLAAWPLMPRLGLKADIITGDRNPHDATLETFNPLFPKLNYFSDANIAVPANLCDIQPIVSLKVTESLRVSGSWNALWRYSREDSFYIPPLQPVVTPTKAPGRYLGQQWSMTAEWRLLFNSSLTAGFVSFTPGPSLRESGAVSGKFFFASIQTNF
jgi:hypothetical protein